MEIAASAGTHDIADEAILHATRNALRAIVGTDRVLLIGADQDGGSSRSSCSTPTTTRWSSTLMLRPKFYRYL